MEQATEQVVISIANKSVGGGVVATGLGWVTSEVIIGGCGLLIAAFSVCIGWYYRHKDDQRKERAFKLKLEQLETHTK